MSEPCNGINLIGHLSSNIGLGVAARNTVRMLEGRAEPFAVVDIRPPLGVSSSDASLEQHAADRSEPAPFSVNLFHLNGPEIRELLWFRYPWLNTTTHLNVAVPFWELPLLPANWQEGLGAMDVVLAPTRFVQEAVERSLPGKVTLRFPQAVYPPTSVAPDRHRFGLEGHKVLFVTSFDMNSDLERKNPWGAIDAFRASGVGDDAGLVVKANNARLLRHYEPHLRRLRAAAAEDPRIVLIENAMSYRDVLSLYASCDVFVSLHRSEGLGLGLMEAMSLGKAVLATGWSGNMDFMTAENSVPVPFDLVPVTSTSIGAYDPRVIGEGQYWAEPRLADASVAIERLTADSGLREQLGQRAASDMDERRIEHSRGDILDTLHTLRLDNPALEHAQHVAVIARLGRHAFYRRARAALGNALRRRGLR